MITQFINEHRFLSNFWPAQVTIEGLTYPSVEHAYQAMKTTVNAERLPFTNPHRPAWDAKRMGRHLTLRPDWAYVRIDIMQQLIRQKFQEPTLREKLLATEDRQLIEGNSWGDRYWGQSPVGQGENYLGRIIMQTRKEIATS